MNELSVVLTLIAGLLLRFGIPIGITALLVYALRRLDQKWQREVELGAQPELVLRLAFSTKFVAGQRMNAPRRFAIPVRHL